MKDKKTIPRTLHRLPAAPWGKGFRVVIRPDGRCQIETTKPKLLAKLVDPRVLAHLLRGLLASDHVASLWQLAALNASQLEVDSVAHQRNRATISLLSWGYMYEAADALGKLNGPLRIRERLKDKKAWDDLEPIRRRWSSGSQLPAKIRNNLSFHLGNEAVYLDGLAELAQSGKPVVFFETDGDEATDTRWLIPHNALFRGLDLKVDDINKFNNLAKKDASRLGNRLNRVLVDLLQQAGVNVPPGAVHVPDDDNE